MKDNRDGHLLLRIGLERTRILTIHWLDFRGSLGFVVEMIGSSYGVHHHVAAGIMWHLVFFRATRIVTLKILYYTTKSVYALHHMTEHI